MISPRIGTLAVGFLLGIGICISAGPRVATLATSDRTVGQIAQERVDVATKGYHLAVANFDKGHSDSRYVAEWAWRRATAIRDLPDATKRITFLQESVVQLRKNLASVEQLSKVGAASLEDVYVAQDRALECELWLVKAKAER